MVFKIASKLEPPVCVAEFRPSCRKLSLCTQVETISLAHNDLASGRIMSTLAHFMPKLANLSLEGNKLGGWKEIEYISGKRGRLEQLRELVLIGNPMRDLEIKNDRVQQYKRYVYSSIEDVRPSSNDYTAILHVGSRR